MVKIRYQLDAFAVSLEMGRYYLLDKHYFDTTENPYAYGYPSTWVSQVRVP